MSARWSRSFAMVALIVAALTACNTTPSSPSVGLPPGTVEVSGAWSGTWTFTTAGVTVTDEVTVTLTQNGSSVTGSWSAAGGASGQISFNATSSVSGTLTINQALLGSTSCNASTTISGSAAVDRLEISMADFATQGVCQWGTGNRFVLTR